MMHSRLNHFPSSSGLATAPPLSNNNENMTMMSSLINKPSSSSSNNGFKTPSSAKSKGSKSSTTRRALGDISNKKLQREGGSRKDGTTSGVQKLQIKQQSRNSLKQAPATTKHQKSSRSSKQVNFVLPTETTTATTTTSSSFDLTGLDPIEMPAGRMSSERWNDNDDMPTTIVPKMDDWQEAVWEQRIQARMRHQERIEQEGEAWLRQQQDQVLLQDELDLQRFGKAMMMQASPQDDSFDLALEADSDSDFLNVSF